MGGWPCCSSKNGGTGTHLSNGGGAVRGKERGLLVVFRHFPRSHSIDIIDLSSSDLFTNMSHLLNLCRLFSRSSGWNTITFSLLCRQRRGKGVSQARKQRSGPYPPDQPTLFSSSHNHRQTEKPRLNPTLRYLLYTHCLSICIYPTNICSPSLSD